MERRLLHIFWMFLGLSLMMACSLDLPSRRSCHEDMIDILQRLERQSFSSTNPFNAESKLPYMDSLLNLPHSTPGEVRYCNYLKANILLELGREKDAIRILEKLAQEDVEYGLPRMKKDLAIAYLKQAERANRDPDHAAESSILPIHGVGVYGDQEGSRKAIALFEDIIRKDPYDIESKWLLNLAYMTVGEYPQNVPHSFFIPGLVGDTTHTFDAFDEVAGGLGLDVSNMAGGSITEDFDNDGYLDIVISSWGLKDNMHYFRNNADGTFSDITEQAGLKGITGGLNIIQSDYDNDGFTDLFVLRGAWKNDYGKEPNSLLKNNGDGTFTDVTTQSGLLSFHPTQTATWNDFNNDGWLDLFIGNETAQEANSEIHPCELFINNQDGTFREIATLAKCDVISFVKGVTSGDYDNDGWQDIFVSSLNGRKLLRNKGSNSGDVSFEDVTERAHLDKEQSRTYATWFWDYNNDGWMDILTGDYAFDKSLAYYAAAQQLGISESGPGHMLLYRNNGDGTFSNVTKLSGLDRPVFMMGGNFGDLDNDGYLDMYLGSGNPRFQSLIPNKMLKNIGGEKFVDVTASARLGHLQKGQAVSIADMDNDGDQDIYIEMGGAYPGDAYENSFFLNPGQNSNKWIALNLVGNSVNRSAIGSRVKITFRENNALRSLYRDVNSGGSFGSSTLRREIGLGAANMIETLEIRWHGSNEVQVFRNIKPNQFLTITQGSDEIVSNSLKKIDWILTDRLCN